MQYHWPNQPINQPSNYFDSCLTCCINHIIFCVALTKSHISAVQSGRLLAYLLTSYANPALSFQPFISSWHFFPRITLLIPWGEITFFSLLNYTLHTLYARNIHMHTQDPQTCNWGRDGRVTGLPRNNVPRLTSPYHITIIPTLGGSYNSLGSWEVLIFFTYDRKPAEMWLVV